MYERTNLHPRSKKCFSFPIFDQATFLGALLTISSAIFVAELTDKDALLLLTLATRIKPWFVFAAGSLAFTVTSAIIVTVGYFLVSVFPVFWIKVAGGIMMVGYGLWEFLKFRKDDLANVVQKEESKLLARSSKKSAWPAFLTAVSMLVALDLAGDATEILTIVFVAHFQNVFLVFGGAVFALVAATAAETVIGNQLRKVLSLNRIRLLSILVFIVIGTAIILTTIR